MKTSLEKSPSQALDSLALGIKQETTAADQAVESALAHYIRAGELLIEAKEQVGHGGWSSWLEANFEFSERHARRYMKVAANRTRVSDLGSMREALQLLSPPACPPFDFRQEMTNDLNALIMKVVTSSRPEVDEWVRVVADAWEWRLECQALPVGGYCFQVFLTEERRLSRLIDEQDLGLIERIDPDDWSCSDAVRREALLQDLEAEGKTREEAEAEVSRVHDAVEHLVADKHETPSS
jgi:hypothetical protein